MLLLLTKNQEIQINCGLCAEVVFESKAPSGHCGHSNTSKLCQIILPWLITVPYLPAHLSARRGIWFRREPLLLLPGAQLLASELQSSCISVLLLQKPDLIGWTISPPRSRKEANETGVWARERLCASLLESCFTIKPLDGTVASWNCALMWSLCSCCPRQPSCIALEPFCY